MREAPAPPRNPRPVVAFFVSLACSTAVLGFLLVSDHRILDLKVARSEIRRLDAEILQRRTENEALRQAIESASRHDFPAERVAREELQLVRPDDIILLFPPDSFSGTNPAPTPRAGAAPQTVPPKP